MAGMIVLRNRNEVLWDSSGWMFDWVANFLADSIADPRVASIIRDRIEANLGTLDLERDIAPRTHDALVLLASSLVPYSRQKFPFNMDDREGALSLLEALASLARDVLGAAGRW